LQKYSKVSIGDMSKQIEIHQRYMDPWEVNELIPTLEYYVRELFTIKKQIASISDVVSDCMTEARNDKDKITDPITLSLREKLKHQCGEYISIIEKIALMGAIVDNIDAMAFDFYSWLDHEEVFLCWQSGERVVSHWHYPEENFSERREVDVTEFFEEEIEPTQFH